MSHEILKEVEIVTQRIDDGQDTHAKGTAKDERKASFVEPVTNARPEGAVAASNQHLEVTSAHKTLQVPPQQQSTNPHGSLHPAQDQDAAVAGPEAPQEEFDIFKDPDEVQKQNYPRLQALLENPYFVYFVLTCTLYALYASDIRIISTNVNADDGFDVVTIIVMAIFTIEIFLSILVKEDYICSFFFWLDIISTLSLILDIQLFSNQVFYGGGGQTSQLAKNNKASSVGTRAGRVVRLVRLIRIVKLYKAASSDIGATNDDENIKKLIASRKNKKVHPSKKDGGPVGNGTLPGDEAQVNNANPALSPQNTKRDSVGDSQAVVHKEVAPVAVAPVKKESRVSKHLSDLTTKRVIVIVLILLFIMPLFASDYYFNPPDSMDFALNQLAVMALAPTNHTDISGLYAAVIDIHSPSKVDIPIVYLSAPFTYLNTYQTSNYNDLRPSDKDAQLQNLDIGLYASAHPNDTVEIANLNSLGDGNAIFIGILNQRPVNVSESALSIGNTVFISLVLMLAAISFSKDANELALAPLERMIDKVNQIAKNPLIAKELKLAKQQDEVDQLETIVIENAIIKIGSLLALGFGDAGSEIIASNMAKSGDVDPMIPGVKKCAIYGFCDIRNFTDATEQLQEDVMLFVNNIGEVVHTMADRYAGAANKNIGDAFLLVWKIPRDKYSINDEDNSVEFKDMEYMHILADFAIVAFMKLQAKINREPKCLAYRKDERLLRRMPGYKVKMGLGLHQGWGIEGAIGSEFKIDASYLSPNVNMAGRLEAGTKIFGVPLLISSDLHGLFTEQMKRYTRFIDHVTVKGATKPMGLYTVDMECDYMPASKEFAQYERDGISRSDRQEIERQKKLEILLYLNQPAEYPWSAEDHISTNKDLHLMMQHWNEKFQNLFSEGFQFYLNGDWQSAKAKFEEAKKIVPEDGPTKNLMEVMGKENFKAPSDWQGYRSLTDL